MKLNSLNYESYLQSQFFELWIIPHIHIYIPHIPHIHSPILTGEFIAMVREIEFASDGRRSPAILWQLPHVTLPVLIFFGSEHKLCWWLLQFAASSDDISNKGLALFNPSRMRWMRKVSLGPGPGFIWTSVSATPRSLAVVNMLEQSSDGSNLAKLHCFNAFDSDILRKPFSSQWRTDLLQVPTSLPLCPGYGVITLPTSQHIGQEVRKQVTRTLSLKLLLLSSLLIASCFTGWSK